MPPPLLPILYGSETGTAQEIAHYLGTKASRRGYRPIVGSLDSMPVEALPLMRLAVFVIATTGDGEAPGNMRKTWKFLLRRSLPSSSLINLRFALLGLGDVTYAKYCAAARRLAVRLVQLGASPLLDTGYTDEQGEGGTWGGIDAWEGNLWSILMSPKVHPALPCEQPDDTPTLSPPLYEVVETLENSTSPSHSEGPRGLEHFYGHLGPPDAYETTAAPSVSGLTMPYIAKVIENRRMTATGHFQDVRHLVLDVSGMGKAASHSAGDVAWVHPENDAASVAEFARLIGLDLDSTIHISSTSSSTQLESISHLINDEEELDGGNESTLENILRAHGHLIGNAAGSVLDLPTECTIRDLLTRYLDILGTPRRLFFERVSLFASNEEERDKLLELASPGGADLLHDYCTREKRTYLEVLTDFSSVRVPLHRLLELIPRLRPRAFSIASSPLAHPGEVHLCVAVVSYKTRLRRQKIGVCSSWISSLTPGQTVPVWIRPGSFKLPVITTPVVLVGPGTGIAPMRSILEHRRVTRQSAATSLVDSAAAAENGTGEAFVPPATDFLFFGCRYEAADFLYGEDFRRMVGEGGLQFRTAFSRDAPNVAGGKVYVQHKIKEAGKELYHAIVEGGASICVAGNAHQMPEDVRAAFRDVLVVHGKYSEAEAEKLLKGLESKGRYMVESWA